MDYTKLNNYLGKSELNTCALMTCDFDPIAFAHVEPHLDPNFAGLCRLIIKHKAHVSTAGTTWERLVSKFQSLDANTGAYEGKAGKPLCWSGVHLNDSDSFFGTIEAPVAINEMSYIIKPEWSIQALNTELQETVNMHQGERVFICTKEFDLTTLAKKKGVRKFSNGVLTLTGNQELKVVVVD